ncbi:synaptotagmin-15-like isoform X2 [Limulus polyphemus]|uniref:Synaptotagmin-15-like isoform X2 n=1 Tax=Limulus polyphemus TaxID=6850 RepID=A0ABM1SHH2_LIMPO|nr:synaptotagmin-15-like isoform X2 [Limulus polyphemus]
MSDSQSDDHQLSQTEMNILKENTVRGASDNENRYLWFIVGGSVGLVIATVCIITVWLYFRRKSRNHLKSSESPSYSTQEICHNGILASSGSEEISDRGRSWNVAPYSREVGLFQSASIDVPSTFRTSSESIQPKAKLSRWNTVGITHYQPTIIGTVQPDLYRNIQDDELVESPFPNGRIWFSILYHEEDQILEVTLVKAKNLPGRNPNQTPRDPFVKLYLLPDEENCQQSKVRRRTLNPKFHETFKFSVTKEDVADRTLRLAVYDVDKRKVRHSLGHVLVPLGKINFHDDIVNWRNLEPTTQNNSSLGEIQVGLSCSPFNSRIKVVVERIRNIIGIDSGEAGVFVKIQLFHGRKMMKTKRTYLYHTNSNDSEIIVNEQFNFVVSDRFFDACSFGITVYLAGPSPLIRDEPYGKVVVGSFLYARGEQLLHWQEMLTNPRNQISKWHNLESITSN